jgi:hypothetical protein
MENSISFSFWLALQTGSENISFISSSTDKHCCSLHQNIFFHCTAFMNNLLSKLILCEPSGAILD